MSCAPLLSQPAFLAWIEGIANAMQGVTTQTARELAFREPVAPLVILLGVAAAVAVAVASYRRSPDLRRFERIALAGLRVTALAALFVLLFDPLVVETKQSVIPGQLLVLVDASKSMQVRDERATAGALLDAAIALGEAPFAGKTSSATRVAASAGNPGAAADPKEAPSRIELVHALLDRPELAFLRGSDGDGDGGDVPEEPAASTPRPPSVALRSAKLLLFGAGLEPVTDVTDLASIRPDGPLAPRTRLGPALLDAADRFRGQPIDGIVVFSDGAANDGEDPLVVARELGKRGIPIFPVGIGIAKPRDIAVRRIVAPPAVLAGDTVSVRAEIESTGFEDAPVDVVVRADGQEIARERVTLESGEKNVDVEFRAEGETGDRRLEVSVEGAEGDAASENDRAGRDLRVIDARIRVLYVEGAPRWEYRYLRNILLRDPRLELRFFLTEGDPQLPAVSPGYLARFPHRAEDFESYDLVILGDASPRNFTAEQLEWVDSLVREKAGAVLFLAGTRYLPRAYRGTPIEDLLPVRLAAEDFVGVPASAHPVPTSSGEALASLSESDALTRELWTLARPLVRLPALEGLKPAATAVLELSAEGAAAGSAYPLVAWQRFGSGKALWVGTDRLWRLRYRQGDTLHARFWSQAIRFLALSRLASGSRRTSIETETRDFRTGERIDLWVHSLDDEFEPRTDPTFTVEVKSPGGGGPRPLVLRASPGHPGLYAGTLLAEEAGAYSIVASEERVHEPIEKTVHVVPFDREALEPALREDLLEAIAELSGGRSLAVRDLPALESLLPSREMTTIRRDEDPLREHGTLFTALLVLLSIEWFWRRRRNLA